MAQVEWDHHTNRPLTVIEDDNPNHPQRVGNERVPQAEPEWLDLEDEYPPDYLPQFSGLLGRDVEYKLVTGRGKRRVVRTHPKADFSEKAIRRAVAGRAVASAEGALSQTHHTVIEAMELGEEVPENVRELRRRIREKRDQIIEMAANQPITRVVDLAWDFDQERDEATGLFLETVTRRPPRAKAFRDDD